MKYGNVCRAVFLERLNRFVARVDLEGRAETVHVKNTGRLRELLVPGSEVWLTRSGNPERKTKYDLIAVRKQNGVLFNIDRPNVTSSVYSSSLPTLIPRAMMLSLTSVNGANLRKM